MITVYRVENKEGKGYLSSTVKWRSNKLHMLDDGTERHQYPDSDFSCDLQDLMCTPTGYKLDPKYIFGFYTMKDLSIWFLPEELEKLYDDGFYVYEITILERDIVRGSRQLVLDGTKIISKQILQNNNFKNEV